MTARKTSPILALLAGTALWAAPVAGLGAPPGPGLEPYVVPSAGVVAPDGDRQTDDGWRVSLAAGVPWDRSWNLEVEGFYEDLGEPAGGHYQFGVAGHALHFVHRWPPFSPFALGGVGVMAVEDFFNEGLRVFGELGGGFTSRLPGTRIAYRVDVRYRQVRHATDFARRPFADAIVGLGLVFPLDRPPPTPPPPDPPLPAVDGDEDGDGVRDHADLCPDTPPETPVNAHGCAADSDLDGVADRRDRCPRTPVDAVVDAFGCEPDTDGDRVVNRLDRCPGTRPGAKVDERGCPPVEVLRLEGVHFEHDRAALTPAAKVVLNGVAESLKARKGVRVEVAGHTDGRGSEAYNLRLSRARARSVMDYLIERGVPQAMLSARGYGEGRPVAGNATAEGRTRNRRVELRISDRP